jgi:UDP-N-acetylglucosamine 2-epimerase (non-hydrolysing)
MSTILIDLIAGARPNFMKIAPIIRALEKRESEGGPLRYRLVHTGQHYDSRMSGDFFDQLGIPPPAINLQVGSGTQAEQTATIMTGYEGVLSQALPAACVVVGDVTSTMATAITAQKQGVPVAHVEAGIRSGDWGMPEEINRRVTDSITDWFFTTSRQAGEILQHEGVGQERIFFVGNTMIDTLLAQLDRLRRPTFWQDLGLESGKYILLTLHRPSNVDDPEALRRLLESIAHGADGMPAVFPVHPRTAKTIARIGGGPAGIVLVDPQPYLEFIFLLRGAKAVVTDSGGITEEATVLGIPCMTLRESTERPETVTVGSNELLGTNPLNIAPAFDALFSGRWKQGAVPEKWDGRAAERIVGHLEDLLATDCRTASSVNGIRGPGHALKLQSLSPAWLGLTQP